MSLRDRFFTPKTAKALLSWRLLLVPAIAALVTLAGAPLLAGVAAGLGVYAVTVLAAMPRATPRSSIDPFAISEPWRQFVQAADRSRRQLVSTVRATPAGPLRDRLQSIADRLEAGLQDSWQIARRGDEIDAMVATLDPVRLRSRLGTLVRQAEAAPTDNLATAISSVESQLASAERLKAVSASTADHLRLTQARLDELVSRAAEVSIGAKDDRQYASDVDDLVLELEAMRQAVQELPG